MTIAIALKVAEGVVLGADSASSIPGHQGGVANVYFNAEKISTLRKGLPIGAVTYGLGGLSGRSVTSLSKDLRDRFSDEADPWHLDPGTYRMEDVASRLKQFFYDDLYLREYEAQADTPPMGFLIAGFSGGAVKSEVWQVEIDSRGACPGPHRVWSEDDAGVVTWKGQPEAIDRLFAGFTPEAHRRLVQAGVSDEAATQLLVSLAPLAHPAMPIQDAIDLVHFLAKLTCDFVRFVPVAPIVSEPIDIAAITKHERFRWVRRKHYFPQDLNPPRGWFDFWPVTGINAPEKDCDLQGHERFPS